jgi:ribonuclease VapC
MIIDTSAICACLFAEPASAQVIEALAHSRSNKISAPTLVELYSVLEHRDRALVHSAKRLLAANQVETVPFTAEHATIAAEAYRTYGKPSSSKANLNLGDCYSYALAAASGEPLLFIGDDFTHTDIQPALPF